MISIDTSAGGAFFDRRRASRAGIPLGAVGSVLLAALACVAPAVAQTAPAVDSHAATAAHESPATTAAPAAWKAPAELRVGITPNYPPLAFERDGRIVGIEPDLAEAVGKVLGSKLVLKPMPWGVWRLTGRFDTEASRGLSGLYRPLTKEELAWAVRKDEAGTLGTALDGALAAIRADGTLEQILDRWITVRKVAIGAPELAPADGAK